MQIHLFRTRLTNQNNPNFCLSAKCSDFWFYAVIWKSSEFFRRSDALLEKLPPYNQIIHFPLKTFDDLLNEHTLFFYDGRDPRDDSPITWDTITSVGFGDQMDNGNFFIRRTSFIPDDPEHMKEYDADMLQSLLEFNNDITAFFDGYIDFLKLPDEPDKTCRDVGAKKRYDDKCKTDPVWQTYNRAYKAHYARYMKKKMTVSEFEEWSRFASELRDKAIAEEIPFEQYYAAIRK